MFGVPWTVTGSQSVVVVAPSMEPSDQNKDRLPPLEVAMELWGITVRPTEDYPIPPERLRQVGKSHVIANT